MGMKVCDETKPDSTDRVFKEQRLTADIKTARQSATLPGCPKPAPAPAAPATPAGSCCPAVVPCQPCAACAECTACPGGASLPGQETQSGSANADQQDTPVVPGSIPGA